MKASIKKRIEILENSLNRQSNRPLFALVIYNSAVPEIERASIFIDAVAVLYLPDNGMRCSAGKEDFKESNKTFYV